MAIFTVFYSHPYHCREGSHYTVDRPSAEIAAKEAFDMLPEDISDEERPAPDALDFKEATSEFETNLSRLADDLEIKVYVGTHTVQPEGSPTYVFE